uniref:Uncharacterized protein n=1 Tax=Magallana gigas TaxID=29159 RepID=A0A8W8M864_MAGGI
MTPDSISPFIPEGLSRSHQARRFFPRFLREEDEQKIILPDLCRLLDDVALHRLRWTTIRNPDPEESLHVARPEVESSANGPECMDRVQILKMAGNVWKTKLNGRRRLLQLLTSWTDR